MSPNDSGGQVTSPAATTKIATATKPQPPQPPQPIRDGRHLVVSATAVPPLGRRALWLLLVSSCPLCGGYSHVHRAGSPTGGIRNAGCGRGSYYVQVVRAQGRVA